MLDDMVECRRALCDLANRKPEQYSDEQDRPLKPRCALTARLEAGLDFRVDQHPDHPPVQCEHECVHPPRRTPAHHRNIKQAENGFIWLRELEGNNNCACDDAYPQDCGGEGPPAELPTKKPDTNENVKHSETESDQAGINVVHT